MIKKFIFWGSIVFFFIGALNAHADISSNDNVDNIQNIDLQGITLEKELVLGNNDPLSHHFFAEVYSIMVDEEENIYVLDGKTQIIKKFDSNGKFIRTIGKSGQGPGEYENPTGMKLIDKSTFVVHSNGRLTYYSTNGEYLKNLNKLTWDINPTPFKNGKFVCLDFYPSETKGLFINALTIVDNDYKRLKVIYKKESRLRADSEKQAVFPNRINYAVLKNNCIVWGECQADKIFVVNEEGESVNKFNIKISHIPITEEEKKQMKSRMDQVNPGNWEFPRFYPNIYDILTDDQNHIIIQNFDHHHSLNRGYTIYDLEGKLLASLSLPNSILLWKNNRLYCLSEQENGLSQIERYTVTWNKE